MCCVCQLPKLECLPPGQVSDLDTAIIAVCDDLFPDHCELFFAQLRVNCLSCSASGQVSTSLFDTMLIVNLENDTIDLAQMIAGRTPRLALDRDDVGFSHAGDCHNVDQLNHEEIEGCLIFTLKSQAQSNNFRQLSKLCTSLDNRSMFPQLAPTPFLNLLSSQVLSLFKESRHTISSSLNVVIRVKFSFMTTFEVIHGFPSNS